MIAVRQLGPGDDSGPAIALLVSFFREEGFDTPEERIARHAREMLALATCGFFCAEAEGRAVGVATVSLEFGIEYGWWAEMGDLYVLPEWRGRGVSQALMRAVEAFLRSRGAAGYQVTVTPFAQEHHDLGRFYARAGFDSEGRLILVKTLALPDPPVPQE